jgi:hypothetical protein
MTGLWEGVGACHAVPLSWQRKQESRRANHMKCLWLHRTRGPRRGGQGCSQKPSVTSPLGVIKFGQRGINFYPLASFSKYSEIPNLSVHRKRNLANYLLCFKEHLTDSLELRLSWESVSRSATQELPRSLYKPEIYYRVQENLPLVPIPQ